MLGPFVVATLASVLATWFVTAVAQAPDFYKGKQIDLYVGYSVGGGYDIYARILARHLGKHLPGKPVVVPKNMEGAGGRRLANWLYQAPPRDGTAFGTIAEASRSIRCLEGRGAQFKATEFGWSIRSLTTRGRVQYSR